MKKWIFLFSIFFTASINISAQWSMVRNVSNEELYCVDFVNSNTGYAAGSVPFSSSIVIKTTDGGFTWDYVLNIPDGDRIECIDFINSQYGLAGTFYGKIFKTTNGGINWTSTQVIVGVDSRILKIKMATQFHGWIGTERGYYFTNSSGHSWSLIVLNYPPFYAHDMYFFNAQTGFVCSSQNIYKTTNSGNSYTNIYNHNTNERISSIKFIDQNTGWACGSHRLIIKTTNGGTNWNLISMDSVQNECHDFIESADFANENVGYYAGQRFCGGIWGTSFQQLLKKTTDGGMTWNNVNFYTGNDAIEDFQFIDSLKAVMVGFHGAVYKNNYAGLTEVNNLENSIPVKSSLSQNYPNPFNPKTIISYEIYETYDGLNILKVFDILGNEVAELVREKQSAGRYSVEFDGSGYTSGIYFYRLSAGDFTETKRMMLLK